MPGSAASPPRSQKQGGALLVTADHGNCELMRDPATGGPHTAHTTNPVPVLLHGRRRERAAGRPAGGRGADPAGADGPGAAARDDRALAAPCRCGARWRRGSSAPAGRCCSLVAGLPRAPAQQGRTPHAPRAVPSRRHAEAGRERRWPRARGRCRRRGCAEAETARRRDAAQQAAAPARGRRGMDARGEQRAAGARGAATDAPLLPLIERLALFPAETLLAVPAPPEEALRGLLVLRGLRARLERRRRRCARPAPRLGGATRRSRPSCRGCARRRPSSSRRPRARPADRGGPRPAGARPRTPPQAARRAADEAARAESAARGDRHDGGGARRGAQQRAGRTPSAPSGSGASAAAARARRREAQWPAPAGPGVTAGRGRRSLPVAGTVVRALGRAPPKRGPANGMSYRAPPAAAWCAPCSGRVVFAAPFRSYGLLMIVDCGGGYHFVLAGFDRLDAKAGQRSRPASRSASCRAGTRPQPASGPRSMSNCAATAAGRTRRPCCRAAGPDHFTTQA